MDKLMFALYYNYSDGSAKPEMIYIGNDKAEAFDALIGYGKQSYFDSYGLTISHSQGYAKPIENKNKDSGNA